MKKNYTAPAFAEIYTNDIILASGYAATNGNENDDILTTSIFD